MGFPLVSGLWRHFYLGLNYHLGRFVPLVPHNPNPVWVTVWVKRSKDILIPHRLEVIQRKALSHDRDCAALELSRVIDLVKI